MNQQQNTQIGMNWISVWVWGIEFYKSYVSVSAASSSKHLAKIENFMDLNKTHNLKWPLKSYIHSSCVRLAHLLHILKVYYGILYPCDRHTRITNKIHTKNHEFRSFSFDCSWILSPSKLEYIFKCTEHFCRELLYTFVSYTRFSISVFK